ncbi:RNA-directed DNA polymerase from mobile element jockey-like protein [Willisornis vidua]|uniref:RNA-directed DNA polymerase from mobile element jockey-like protein n=1 Tax=Willisornis vidua TaxID=1566151 RepID=A0ABQ9CNV0_9PASS|nr:RNA-directed DNA polymerase from mobile element jockey-like protein [Willisornis vidua]
MVSLWDLMGFIKELDDVITRSLSRFLNDSWEYRDVPVDWKLATLSVFKKDKKHDTGNHKSISLTSVTDKIMEKIILRVTEKHLKDNAIINHSQPRFMRGKSCLSNLISFYNKRTQLVGQWKPAIIFLDFSKTFNTLSHGILLDKMSSTAG